jgi:hypothetical protein
MSSRNVNSIIVNSSAFAAATPRSQIVRSHSNFLTNSPSFLQKTAFASAGVARAHFKTGYHARERVLAVLGNDDAKAYLPRGPEQRLGRRQTLRIEVAGFDVREPAGMIDL